MTSSACCNRTDPNEGDDIDKDVWFGQAEIQNDLGGIWGNNLVHISISKYHHKPNTRHACHSGSSLLRPQGQIRKRGLLCAPGHCITQS